jgi:hypothetical protein
MTDDPLAQPIKAPALSFKGKADGTVLFIDVEEPVRTVQRSDYDTGSRLYWDPAARGQLTTTPNDNPAMAAVFNGVGYGGEIVSLWAEIPSDLLAKLRDAQEKLGRRIGDGFRDRIHVKLVRREPVPGTKKEKKIHAVKVEELGKKKGPDPLAEPPDDDPWATASNATATPASDEPPF